MSYFSDLDIERQEQAQRDTSAVVMDPGDMRALNARTDAWIAAGMKGALQKLFTAGAVVAEEAYCLNTKLYGVLPARPAVLIEDSETIRVTHRRVRPRTVAILAKNLKEAKRREWPKAILSVK